MGLFTKRSKSAAIAVQMHFIAIPGQFYPVTGFHDPNDRLCAHWALVIGDDCYELAAVAQDGYQRAYAAMDFDRKLSRSGDELNGDNVNEWEEYANFLLRVKLDKDLSVGVQSLNGSDQVFASGVTTPYNPKAPPLVHTKGRAWNKTKPETRVRMLAGELPNYDARLVAQQATYIYQAVFQTNYDPVLYSSQVFVFYLVASINLSRGRHIQLSPSLSNKLDGGNKWRLEFEMKYEDSLAIVSLIIYQMWKAGIAVVEEKPKDFGVRWATYDEPISFRNAPWRRPKIDVKHIDFRRVIPPWHMKLLLEVPRDRTAEFEGGIAEKYGLQDSTAMKVFLEEKYGHYQR